MELEHLFQQTTYFMTLQAVFMASLYVAEQMTGIAMVRGLVRSAASVVVNAGPFTLLVYMLFEVSRYS